MANEHDPQQGFTEKPAPTVTSAITETPPETRIELPTDPTAATDASRSVPMDAGVEPPPRWLSKADAILMFLVLVLAFLLGSMQALNSDIYLHLATGRLIAQGQYQFGVDPFSCSTGSVEGRAALTWVNHNWLYDWLTYLLYTSAGGAGLVIAKAVLVTLTTLFMLRVVQRRTSGWFVAFSVALAVLALSARTLLQPTVVSFMLFAVTLYVLNRAGVLGTAQDNVAEPAPRLLWVLPPLFVLWVNLDNWFVFGPLALGLAWAALGVQKLLRIPNPVPAKLVGLVFGVGLVACLLNPFHVRAFELPPEMAYVLVRTGHLMGLQLPEAFFAGGHTLYAMQQVEPLYFATLSPISSAFLGEPDLGQSVAGFAFYPLLVLSLLSFVVNGLISQKPGAPTFSAVRFGLWLVLAALAVSVYRAIPFFAVVAGPMLALNLSEFAAWLALPRSEGGVAFYLPQVAKLSRLLGVAVGLVMLAAAWPGWLHGNYTFRSPRRVAWEVRDEPSLRQAALKLGELKAAGQCGNVFNLVPDIAHYCAWHAPEVKCFEDFRFNLFAPVVAEFNKARRGLRDKARPGPDEWKEVFQKYGIDHVVVQNFLTVESNARWWAEARRWRQQYGDARVVVFALAPRDHPWPTDALLRDYEAAAFGPVPAGRRLAANGPEWADDNDDLWDLYVHGRPDQAPAVQEFLLLQQFGQIQAALAAERWRPTGKKPASDIAFAVTAQVFGPASLTGAGPVAAPVGADALNLLFTASRLNYGPPARRPVFRLADPEVPAAVPLLLVRQARTAIAERRQHPDGYLSLSDAYRALAASEDWWVNYRGDRPPQLRDELRATQALAALYAGVQLQPESWQQRIRLAQVYEARNLLDLARDQAGAAVKLHAEARTGDRKPEQIKGEKQGLEEYHKHLEELCNQREFDFEVKASAASPVRKIEIAAFDEYTLVDRKTNKEMTDPRGRGLAGKAIELAVERWQELSESPKKDEQEYRRVTQRLVALLFKTGQVQYARNVMFNPKSPRFDDDLAFRNRVLIAGTLGNYEDLDATLADSEAFWAAKATEAFQRVVSMQLLAQPDEPVRCWSFLGLSAAGRLHPPGPGREPADWEFYYLLWQRFMTHYYESKSLRALSALEQGDTAKARTLFAELVRDPSSGAFCMDRVMAQRYLNFLDRYQPGGKNAKGG